MTAEAPTRGKVFISYSRRDLAFADRLCEALKARGFEPLIDRSDIYVFEEWWPRLQALVMQADTILFVLSPASVGSRVCGDEVNYAAGLNKRFAPLLYQKVDNKQVPEALRRLNYLHFDDPERFDHNLETLIKALTIDIDWVRKHTEWGALARRWKEAGKPGPRGLLLRPPPLEDAERWIALRPAGAPMPTEETQAFIAESRRAETRRRTRSDHRFAIDHNRRAHARHLAEECIGILEIDLHAARFDLGIRKNIRHRIDRPCGNARLLKCR